MFCPNCGEHYNFSEPRCPWCGASKPQPKPHKESSNEKDEPVEIEVKEKIPLKTRLYSKRYVAALILFIIGIKSLTVITRDAFIAEYPDTIDYNSPYFIAFVFLICIPFLGVLGFMYDSGKKGILGMTLKTTLFLCSKRSCNSIIWHHSSMVTVV